MTEISSPKAELRPKTLLIAFAATLGLMTSSPSIVSAPQGLLLVPMTHAFGIGRGTLNIFTGVSMLVGAALTPLVGRLMNSYGVRRVVIPGVIVFGVAQMLMGVVPISTPLLIAAIMLQGAVSCLVTPLAYTKVITLWFHRRRGIVLGVASAVGIGGGSGVCAILVGGLNASAGWRAAFLGTGVYVLVVGLLIVLPFLHEPAVVERAAEDGVPAELPGITLGEALKLKSVRLVLLMVVTVIGGLTIMMGHGPALLAGRGLNIGAPYLGCAALGSLGGQLVCGALLDRIDSPKVGLGFALATLVGGVIILFFGTSAQIVLPATVLMGVGQGAETGMASYFISRFCGLKAYASIFGVVMAMITASAAIFPPMAGYVFDLTGSYNVAMPFIVVLLAVPSLAIALMPPYRFKASAVVH